MPRIGFSHGLVLLVATALTGVAGAESPTPVESEAQDESASVESEEDPFGDLDTIVITARRREEFLNETPVAATVLGGNLLDARGVETLDEIGAYVPNLTSFSGVQHQGSYYSRGVGQRDAVVTLDPGVGIYVDDVYVSRGQGALLPTLDLERVEVLRGPQGTLYGKNTIGGAVKLVTRKPGPRPEIMASISGGNFDTIRSASIINVPLIDDALYSRFAIATRNADGYSTNINDVDYNDDQSIAMRGQLRWLPHEYVTVDLAADWSREVERARAAKCRISNPATAGFIPGLAPSCAAAQASPTHSFATNRDEKYELESYGTALTAAWDVGPVAFFDSFDLKSITSWQQQLVDDGFLDLDATEQPFVGLWTIDPIRQSQISQEIQSVSALFGDRVRLTSGLYGFWEDTRGGDTFSNAFGTTRQERVEIDNASYAIYTQSSWSPYDWIEVTSGLRWTYEDKQAARTIVSGATGGEIPFERRSRSFDRFTPTAGIALRAPESLLDPTPLRSAIAYFNYGEGYKSGGFSTRRDPTVPRIAQFASEELENFELGFKLDAWEGALTLDLALFHSKYENIQLTVSRVNPASPPFQPDIGSSIANAGAATIQGLELEAILRPLPELTVRGALGLTDASYDRFIDQTWDINPGTGLVENVRPLDRSNEPFFNIPSLSFDGTVEWTILPERFGLPDIGEITPIVHVYHQTASHSHFTAAGHASGAFRQKPYTLVDLRILWNLWDDRSQIAVFANNVTDVDYFQNAVDLTNTIGVGGVYYAQPRTIGAEFRYRWSDDDWLEW